MLGLRRHIVRVVEHDPAWALSFEDEARAIRRAGGGLILDLQHVGSTAVPGLPAKPILDIAVAVRSAGDVPELVRRLTTAGYLDRGDGGDDGGYLLVRDSGPDVRTVHLHIVEQSDPQWRRYLAFRDLLRRDAGIRAGYGDLKRRLAAAYPNDRERYTNGKHGFIRETLEGDEAAQAPAGADGEGSGTRQRRWRAAGACSGGAAMRVEAFIVNAFTDRLACGNPAAVVVLDRELSAEAMQTIAFDMNKSETAFVTRAEADGAHAIRWFTPLKEVPLCGHATLAASQALYETAPYETVAFRYAHGLLAVTRAGGGAFEMDFPLDDYDVVEPEPVYRSFFPGVAFRECIHGRKTRKVIVRIDADADLGGMQPDFAAMKAYHGLCSNGIGVTKRSSRYDCESRYFNPWYGVDEDPVTGSVHTVLARYWGRILGKERLRAYQASHRPGELGLRIEGERVKIAGKARIVMRGTIEL